MSRHVCGHCTRLKEEQPHRHSAPFPLSYLSLALLLGFIWSATPLLCLSAWLPFSSSTHWGFCMPLSTDGCPCCYRSDCCILATALTEDRLELGCSWVQQKLNALKTLSKHRPENGRESGILVSIGWPRVFLLLMLLWPPLHPTA